MATPHVAGAVALLWSAQPELRNDVAATETILDQTAVPISSSSCGSGSPGSPNNIFGFGRLDIKATVDAALLRATDIIRDESGSTVKFYAVAGRSYRLEWKHDLAETWQAVPDVLDFTATTTGPAQLTDPASDLDRAFYRVRLLP